MAVRLPSETAGKITESVFVNSTLAIFIVALLSVSGQFYVRFRIKRVFEAKDGLLILGVCCLICAEALLFVFKDDLYIVEASSVRATQTALPSDFVQRAVDFKKRITGTLILLWITISAVRFSFLFQFRMLLEHIRPLKVYWRVTAGFNLLVVAFGFSKYFLPCQYINHAETATCGYGNNAFLLRYSIATVVLDIVGDLMILALPICLLGTTKIPRTQKPALVLSLCLIAIFTVFTAVRSISIRTAHDAADVAWISYWHYILAEVGIILAALTVCRPLLVRRRSHASRRTLWYSQDAGPTTKRTLVRSILASSSWRGRSGSSTVSLTEPSSAGATEARASKQQSPPLKPETTEEKAPAPRASRRVRPSHLGFDFGFDRLGQGFPVCVMPSTPRMTGIRTLIAGGRASRVVSRTLPDEEEEEGDVWRLPVDGVIKVEHGIESYSIHVNGSETDLTRGSKAVVPNEEEGVPELPGSDVPEMEGSSGKEKQEKTEEEDGAEQV